MKSSWKQKHFHSVTAASAHKAFAYSIGLKKKGTTESEWCHCRCCITIMLCEWKEIATHRIAMYHNGNAWNDEFSGIYKPIHTALITLIRRSFFLLFPVRCSFSSFKMRNELRKFLELGSYQFWYLSTHKLFERCIVAWHCLFFIRQNHPPCYIRWCHVVFSLNLIVA